MTEPEGEEKPTPLRRTYLQALLGGGFLGMAGCQGPRERDRTTYLSDPTPETPSEDIPYPAHGQTLPEVTLTAPLHNREVSTYDFPNRDIVMTFFYSHCKTVCPRLVAALANIQRAAAEAGWSDRVVFLPVTFDPERDTAERLREWGHALHVDFEAGNWYFLRPSSRSRTRATVEEAFGVVYDRTNPKDMDMYMFDHVGLILLANQQNYIERPYLTNQPRWQDIYADFETLRDREG